MAAQLSLKEIVPIVPRELLEELVDLRLREAKALIDAGLYVGAVYLGGYAVECQFKYTICKTLDWDTLKATFKTHDLELLAIHSGVDAKLQAEPPVKDSFAKIRKLWTEDLSLRYRGADAVDEKTASLFLEYVNDRQTGIVPWLRRMTS